VNFNHHLEKLKLRESLTAEIVADVEYEINDGPDPARDGCVEHGRTPERRGTAGVYVWRGGDGAADDQFANGANQAELKSLQLPPSTSAGTCPRPITSSPMHQECALRAANLPGDGKVDAVSDGDVGGSSRQPNLA
jgi:hypothetical protein